MPTPVPLGGAAFFSLVKDMTLPQSYKSLTPFTSSSSVLDWQQFLNTLIATKNVTFVWPTIVAYKTKKQKNEYLQSAIQHAYNTSEPGKHSFEKVILEWYLPCTAQTPCNSLKSGGSLVVVSSPVLCASSAALESKKAEEDGGEESMGWHSCALYWEEGVIGIYDPNFEGDHDRLHNLKGVIIIKAIVETMKGKRRAVKEIWVGGGGNYGNNCQEMTRSWLEEEVVVQEGKNLGSWKERGWVKLKF